MPIFEKHMFNDDRIPFIINKVSAMSGHPNNEWGNLHENIEMVFVKKGRMNMLVDGESVSATEGATIIINQNVLHSMGSYSSVDYYYLIIDSAFCHENHLEIEKLYFETLVYDLEVFEKLDVLIDHYYGRGNDKFAVQKIRSAVLSLLCLICERYSIDGRADDTVTTFRFVKQAIEYVFNEFQSDISLDNIAKRVCISKYHFAREFRKATGHTFVDFLNGVRCENAKQLLEKTNKSISEIYSECGFSSSSYFCRMFKVYTGVTPLRYRRNVREKQA